MRVLYHAERQAFPGHRDGIHVRGQPPPPGIRIDLGQLHIGIGDAHQVIEERQVLRVCIANLGIDLRSGGMRVKTLDAGGRAQQPRHDVEGIWLVCDSQKAVNTRAERSALQRRWQERRRTHRSRRQPAAVILLSCGVNRSGALYFART